MDAAAQITDARRRAGLTTRQLALRAGTSHSTISAYEKGRKSPTVVTLSRLIAACGFELVVTLRATGPFENRAVRGEELVELLALADQLPSGGREPLRQRFPSSRYDDGSSVGP